MLLDNAWTEYDLAPLLRFPRALKHPFTPAIDSHSTVDWLAFRLNINRWLSRLLYSLKGVALSFVADRSFAFDRTSCSNSATVPVQRNCAALTGWHDSSHWCIFLLWAGCVVLSITSKQQCPPQLSSCWVIASPRTPNHNTMRNDDVLRGLARPSKVAIEFSGTPRENASKSIFLK